MGEARARKRREAIARAEQQDPPARAPQVPELQSVCLSKRVVEQAERRLPMTTYARQEFFDQIVEAGIAWFDMELDNLQKAKAQPAESLVQPATHIPRSLAETSDMLQEIKRGQHAAEAVKRGTR